VSGDSRRAAAAARLYVATDQGVCRSADGGRTWQAWSEGLYPGVMSVELLLFAPDRLLRLVTHGNGIWQRHLPAS
jgi:ligand-binding sensor domain-containing protein